MPAANMITTRARPNGPGGWRRQKLSATPASERLRSGSSSTSPATAARLGATIVIAGSLSREADARIEPGVEQVDHEIGDDEDDDDEHDQRLGQHVVLVLHRLDEQPADAVQV